MTWNRSVPLRQMVHAVAPAARMAATSSGGTARWAASYSASRPGFSLVCKAIRISLLSAAAGDPGDDQGHQDERAIDEFQRVRADPAVGQQLLDEREDGDAEERAQ